MTVTQPELNAAYKAARAAIEQYSPSYSSMISDEMLQSIIAPAVRAALNVHNVSQTAMIVAQPKGK